MSDIHDEDWQKKVDEIQEEHTRDYLLHRVGVGEIEEATRRIGVLQEYLREEQPRDLIAKGSIFCHNCDRKATHELLIDPDVPQVLQPPTCMACGRTHYTYGLIPLLEQLGVPYR